nr:catalase [Mycobacterium lepraemurium]
MAENHTTTNPGAQAPSNELSLTVGPDGPLLLQDSYLVEQMAAFNRVCTHGELLAEIPP